MPTFRELLYLPASHANFSRLLHLPISRANFSRVILPANFSCQLLLPTFRELLHPPTSPANFSRVTLPASFSCQLFENYMTCQLLMATLRELLHPPTLPPNYSRVTSPASFSCQVFENYFACQLLMLTFRELLHLHQLASMLPGHSSSSLGSETTRNHQLDGFFRVRNRQLHGFLGPSQALYANLAPARSSTCENAPWRCVRRAWHLRSCGSRGRFQPFEGLIDWGLMGTRVDWNEGHSLGVDSFSILFKHRSFHKPDLFPRFPEKKDPWEEWKWKVPLELRTASASSWAP